MRTRCTLTLMLTILVGVVAQSWAAPAVVYVRGADGKWAKLAASQEAGRITVSLGVAQIGAGQTALVVNKPAWMVLDDNEAPKLAWAKLNGKEVKPGADGDLGVLASFPTTLSLGFKDNANPLDPRSVTLSLSPAISGLKIDATELGPTKTSGRLGLTFPKLPAGRYTGTIQVSDLSPQANVLRVPIAFSVIGITPSADNQTISICTGANNFTVSTKPNATVQVGNAPAAYLTTSIQGQYMYLEKITEVQVLSDTPQVKSVRVICLPGKTDKGNDGSKLARLEYDLTIRSDLPCLLVKSRTVNLAPKGGVYCWWGWLPGQKYYTPKGIQEWAAAYKDIGKVGWVFLPATNDKTNSIGWIAPGKFGESRFNTMLLYTDPTTITTEQNGTVEIPFALMSAKTPEEVAAVADKIKALGLW